jgi:hypothetical protein
MVEDDPIFIIFFVLMALNWIFEVHRGHDAVCGEVGIYYELCTITREGKNEAIQTMKVFHIGSMSHITPLSKYEYEQETHLDGDYKNKDKCYCHLSPTPYHRHCNTPIQLPSVD